MKTRIDAGDFPSAVYLVGERSNVVFADALGNAVALQDTVPARLDTIYDVASLTKVLVTTLMIAKLIDDGLIAIEEPVAAYLPEFDRDDKRAITVRNLLTHDSGFRGWLPFYLLTDERDGILERIAADPLENPTGSKVVYSDLNFLTLTFLIERNCNRRIDEVAKTEIFEPLGLEFTMFNPPADLTARIAACENGNQFELQTCAELGYPPDRLSGRFREYPIRGEVHDGNCWFMGGVSGHAGLFSTAVEIFTIAKQFLASETTLLRPYTCGLFNKNLTAGLNEARSIGFQLAQTPDSTASRSLTNDSFGHLGFTGTSLWIEPSSARVFILLTNRTHVRELPFANINGVRRRFHELAVAAIH